MSEQAEPGIKGQTSLPDSKGLGGRPRKLNDFQTLELYKQFDEYTRDTEDPTISDFVTSNAYALEYNITKQNIVDWQEFAILVKRVATKQEAYLLKHAGNGSYNPTLAIFRLKQPLHGYRDRYETDVTSNGESIGLTGTQAEQLLALRAERGNEDS